MKISGKMTEPKDLHYVTLHLYLFFLWSLYCTHPIFHQSVLLVCLFIKISVHFSHLCCNVPAILEAEENRWATVQKLHQKHCQLQDLVKLWEINICVCEQVYTQTLKHFNSLCIHYYIWSTGKLTVAHRVSHRKWFSTVIANVQSKGKGCRRSIR